MSQLSSRFEPQSAADSAFEAWAARLDLALVPTERERLQCVWQYALGTYGDSLRASGEGRFEHAQAVASVVAGLHIDVETVSAALLHDLPWCEGYNREALTRELGGDLADLVDGATRVAAVSELRRASETGTRDQAQRAEALRKMLLAMAQDVRVVFVALAERLQELRTLRDRPAEVRTLLAQETMELFAPLANRLGIWQLKWQLEDLSFRYLEPASYRHIAGLLAEKRVAREDYIDKVQRRLSASLSEAGIDAEVTGRPKHIYSIWRKMRHKGMDFNNLFDIRAFRVLVASEPQCYAALGVAHALWQPIPKEFDDYVATPKENYYRSLHTAVVGPEGKSVEIQIRTREMHQQAELGIAAHWRYKEGSSPEDAFDAKIAWLRTLLETGAESGDEEDLIDRFRAEILQDRVYVITPQGDVVDLPRGATPLDFAYHIHSEVGHRCRGAKVDGRIKALTHELCNGGRVEILTARRPAPSRDWLNPALGYLRTPRARAKVRAWFRRQELDKTITEGRAVLDRELHRLGLTDIALERVAARSKRFPKLEDFLAAIGRGEISAGQIAGLLSPELLPEPAEVPPTRRTTQQGRRTGDDDVSVYGVGNLLTRMAGCCQPAPGDPIVGFITRGEGVTIHRRSCRNVAQLAHQAEERLIDVSWNDGPTHRYPVNIVVTAFDRQGLIKDITAVLNNEHANVVSANTRTDPQDQQARMDLSLEVVDIEQMSRVMNRLAGLRNVCDVRRVPPSG